MNPLILRQENFGGLLYDRKTHELVVLDTQAARQLTTCRDTKIDLAPLDADAAEFPIRAPLRVFLTLTRHCNLHCKYCSTSSGRERHEQLEYEEIKNLLQQLRTMAVFELALNGGEPVEHPEFFQIIEFANAMGLVTYLNTNGVMSRTKLERLARAGISKIKVSIDGMRESNDALRGRGSFDRAIEAVRYLKKTGNQVRITAVLSRRTAGDLIHLIDLANDCDCDLKIAPLVKVGRAQNFSEPYFSLQEAHKMNAAVDEHCRRNAIKKHVEFCSSLFSHFAEPKGLSKNWKTLQEHIGCVYKYLHLTVDVDGGVYDTGQQTDFVQQRPLGNIRTSAFGAIWSKIATNHELERRHDAICTNCDFNHYLVETIRASGKRRGEFWASDISLIPFGQPSPT